MLCWGLHNRVTLFCDTSQQNCSWAACTVSSSIVWISAISHLTCHHIKHNSEISALQILKLPFWILIPAGATEAEAYPGCFLRNPARSVWLAFWHLLENLGCPTGLGMCTGPLPRVPRKCELATSPRLFEVGNITVNFPWKWRSQILANLTQSLVMKSLQLFFLRVVLTKVKKSYRVPSSAHKNRYRITICITDSEDWSPSELCIAQTQ